jgi:hypothetical protein
VPRGPAPYPRENRLERLLVERYGKLPGVVVLDLTAAFRADEDPSRLFLDNPSYEVHWNRAGHDLVASVLEQAIDRASGPGLDPQWTASLCEGSADNCEVAAVRP